MWSLVSNASIVVQLVMLTLVAASVTSWIMIFQRSNLLRAGRRALESFEERFWSGIDLSKLYRQAGSNPDPDSGVEQIFRAGFKEFSRLRQQPGVDPEAVMEGVARPLLVAIPDHRILERLKNKASIVRLYLSSCGDRDIRIRRRIHRKFDQSRRRRRRPLLDIKQPSKGYKILFWDLVKTLSNLSH